MQKIDIVCPVYREEKVVQLFHERLASAIAPLAKRFEVRIVYIVDPSPDRTEELLSSISATDPAVEVLVMSRRFGHQAALIAGIELSDADALVMLDSDLQHPPELIPELVSHWENGADVVQAVRQDASEIPPLKRCTSRYFYKVLGLASGVQLPIGASDYRLLTRRVCDIIGTQLTEQNPFLRGLVSWVGFNTVLVPYRPLARGAGQSNYSVLALVNFAVNGIFSFSKLPLRACTVLGFSMAALGFLCGFVEVVIYLSGTAEVPGWASIFTAVTFMGGMQLFFLGVIGEYMSQIFDEVKSRPRYIIDRQYKSGRAVHFSRSCRSGSQGNHRSRTSDEIGKVI